MKIIKTDQAAQPIGPYSQAIVHGNTIYVSAQLGINPKHPDQMGSVEEQLENALRNVEEILKAAGSNLNKVMKVTILISDMKNWQQINQIYMSFFKEHRPARSVIPIGPLPRGFQVAIDVIASV